MSSSSSILTIIYTNDIIFKNTWCFNISDRHFNETGTSCSLREAIGSQHIYD